MPNTPGVIRSKKQQEQDDRKAAQKLKPHLRKFVIDEQTRSAKQAHEEKIKKAEELLADVGNTKRAAQLAMIAMLDKKLWRLWPPPVQMSWTSWGVRDQNDKAELHTDLAGFSSFLLREYDTYKHHKGDKKGYPNPMDEKELPFFWQKFCADLKMLIEADARRVALGNQGVIIVGGEKN